MWLAGMHIAGSSVWWRLTGHKYCRWASLRGEALKSVGAHTGPPVPQVLDTELWSLMLA